jgi:hypothetical protein
MSYELATASGCHRAITAFLALSLLCLAVSFLALAGPPFKPPLRPSATAFGSFFFIDSRTAIKNWHQMAAGLEILRGKCNPGQFPERVTG